MNAVDLLGNCSLDIDIGIGKKPSDAPLDAAGWFHAILPSFKSKDKVCPSEQVGITFTVGECSAKVWLLDNSAYQRDHEFSHVNCLNSLESRLSSIAVELGCECPSPCYNARVAWILIMADYLRADFEFCIALRDCKDNGNGKASSKWCADFASKELTRKDKLKAVQEASDRRLDACNNL